MIDTTEILIIMFLVFGGFVFTLFTEHVIGIAFMCLGIWLMQIIHEIE